MMLTSTGSGPVSSIGRTKTYYPAQKRGTLSQPVSGPNFDSATFSAPAGRKSFQLEMVSRLAQEVRTANTTGDIQELHRKVSAGEYTPDPMAIAGRMLLVVEE
ncbi:MAG: hypothetical protein HFG04_10020 [Oscillibacter sp.]|jgi:hypothetical protein|nr:hypothetical protein [Oscillibacter sp.]MCI9001935.1 hypothetical protein [Oscillibacter sp.]